MTPTPIESDFQRPPSRPAARLVVSRVAKQASFVWYHSRSCSTGGSTDEAPEWLLEKSLGRSLDGLLEGPLDELYDTGLSTSSSILTTGEKVDGGS